MEHHQVNCSVRTDRPSLLLLSQFNTHLEQSYEEEADDFDDDRCYQMEIDQLKRQNNFLKKKIAELLKQTNCTNKPKRQSLPPTNFKPPPKLSDQQSQNYIVIFFQEVTELLNSFSHLFQLGQQTSLPNNLASQQQIFNSLTKEQDDLLHRQLAKILLQPEQQRFAQLLEIFENYYRQNRQRSRLLHQNTESLTAQVIQIGRRMANSVKIKEKLKGSMMLNLLNEYKDNQDELSLKSSFIKSTCTDSQIDLSSIRFVTAKDKHYPNPF